MDFSRFLVFFHRSEKDIKDLPLSLQVQGLVESQVLHDGAVREYRFASTEAQCSHHLRTSLERQGLFECCSISSPLTLQNSACVVSVEGMTCNSCVKLIETTISVVPGVSTVKVSLQFKKAFVEYNPSVVKPAELARSIYDMGFDAEVLTTFGAEPDATISQTLTPEVRRAGSELVETTPPTTPISSSSIVIDIEGMTCSSCVQNIESNISKERGVVFIQVSLQDKNAKVVFQAAATNAQKLADAIEGLGFEAIPRSSSTSLIEGVSGSITPPISQTKMLAGSDWNAGKLKVCHIGIDGMTCHSCVSLIESTVGDLKGVVSVSVSLACKEGTVEFNDASTSPTIISEVVDKMGFAVTYVTGKELGRS